MTSEPTLNMSIAINRLDNSGIIIFNLHFLTSLQLQGICVAGLNTLGNVVAVYQIPTVLDLDAIYQKPKERSFAFAALGYAKLI